MMLLSYDDYWKKLTDKAHQLPHSDTHNFCLEYVKTLLRILLRPGSSNVPTAPGSSSNSSYQQQRQVVQTVEKLWEQWMTYRVNEQIEDESMASAKQRVHSNPRVSVPASPDANTVNLVTDENSDETDQIEVNRNEDEEEVDSVLQLTKQMSSSSVFKPSSGGSHLDSKQASDITVTANKHSGGAESSFARQNNSVLKYEPSDHAVEKDKMRHVNVILSPVVDSSDSRINVTIGTGGLKTMEASNMIAHVDTMSENKRLAQLSTQVCYKAVAGIESKVVGKSHILSQSQINQIEAVSDFVYLSFAYFEHD